MSNVMPPHRERTARASAYVPSWFACAVLLCACSQPSSPADGAQLSEQKRQDLLIGYNMLADTLSDESRLGTLEVVKKLMLDSPNDAIGKLMSGLSDASKRRADELEKLRKRTPDVSDKPAHKSPMGEAVTDIAKEFGQSDMLSRNGGFDVRFVLVQAQATRMVAAMATATARFDPDPDRKVWLRRLALEYEGYRADLIAYLGGRAADK